MAELKTPSVPALERALRILESLASSRDGLTLPEMSRQLRLPKSSVHCLLVTLERAGYLHRNDRTGRYLFSSKMFSLANMSLSGLELRQIALPHMRGLMERTGLTVHLAILERYEAVLIEKVEPPGILRLATWLGKRMDVHCTGLGKALIAYLPEAELALLAQQRGLPRHNDNSIVSMRKLKEDLARVRALGVAIDDEEDEVGHRCIGAPVFDEAGELAAAVSVSATIAEIHEENSQMLTRQVKNVAMAISQSLAAQESSGDRRAVPV